MKKIVTVFICLLFILPLYSEQIAMVENSGSWVYLYNSQGRKYKSLSASSVGQVVGFSSSIFVSVKGSWIYVYDADGKKITSMSVSTVGDVIGVAGDTFTSKKGNWIYTWSKEGKKLGSRYSH